MVKYSRFAWNKPNYRISAKHSRCVLSQLSLSDFSFRFRYQIPEKRGIGKKKRNKPNAYPATDRSIIGTCHNVNLVKVGDTKKIERNNTFSLFVLFPDLFFLIGKRIVDLVTIQPTFVSVHQLCRQTPPAYVHVNPWMICHSVCVPAIEIHPGASQCSAQHFA